MVKRILAVVLLGVALPVLANASWFLNTQAKTSGGSLSSRNMAEQRSVSGSVFKSYTTHASMGVTVAADTGYTIRSVVLNGTDLGPQPSPYLATVQGVAAQSVLATFAAIPLQVSAQAGNGGAASPASYGPVVYGTKLNSPLTFYFTPQANYYVTALNGATGATLSTGVPGAAGQQVKVTYPAGYVFTAPIALSASFASSKPVASAGLPQTALSGQTVTLKGANIGSDFPTSYTWSYLSGPANQSGSNGSIIPGPPVTLTQSGATATLEAPATPGTYLFQVTLTGGSTATTAVNVTNSLLASSRSQCQFCHTSNNVGGPQLFSNWSASQHRVQKITCDKCHLDVSSGGHPGSVTSGSVDAATYNYVATGANFCASCHVSNVTLYEGSRHKANGVGCASCHSNAHNPAALASVCDSCHRDQSGQVANHPIDMGGSACVSCHNPHSTQASLGAVSGKHFNNVTSAGYPASYVTSRATCANCHNAQSSSNQAKRQQWGASGHADTAAKAFSYYDFKTRDLCVRCHTTTGFIAFSSAKVTKAWGVASDKTKEVITCVACHSDIAQGTVRAVTPNRPFADEPAFANHDVATSNICVDCHSGLNNGQSIAKHNPFNNFTTSGFIAPHYMTAGGSLQGKSGYHFPGRSYADYSSNSHRKIGMGNNNGTGSAGPCVACHMGGTEKHKFQTVTFDQTGTAIASITSSVCANCHTGLQAADLESSHGQFANALAVLGATLTAKGHAPLAAYPYFLPGGWGTGDAGANVMGAAYNYKLFASEQGAYAHNPEYARQLIIDSIDAAYNDGTVTGNIDSVLNALYGDGKITDQMRSSLTAYKQPEQSCSSCHGNPPASGTHLAQAVVPGTCANCHVWTGPGSDTHNNGTVDFNLSCSSCHGYPPAVLTVALSGHTGLHTAATDCATCHGVGAGSNAAHKDGRVETTCVACHGNPPAALTVAISGHTGTHTTATDCATCHGAGAGAAGHNNGVLATTCTACHGNPPTAQTIHTTGSVQYTHSTVGVVYTDCTVCHDSTHRNGTVDLKTNDNACSACHSYPPASPVHAAAIAGSAPNCTTCHNSYTGYSASTHNNGTVNVSADLACDTCHGYPPLPAAVLAARQSGEFVNAKLESYANGGGYHASHLLTTVSASQGFTPCLPCHPSTSHRQGGSVLRANINVFDAADVTFRFNSGLPKAYDSIAWTCSNVSCHFQSSPAWNQ
jgi:hypothetical protein